MSARQRSGVSPTRPRNFSVRASRREFFLGDRRVGFVGIGYQLHVDLWGISWGFWPRKDPQEGERIFRWHGDWCWRWSLIRRLEADGRVRIVGFTNGWRWWVLR